ncbi:NAD(P)H-hydrate dehydratase [Allofustis seminis]|uniref:NAD(P)H-hydrate dehydratase n=1 Tax=Allofustis seminis TaxID=166939 RepID=UPI000375F037|nr:NAD(P)H-hydrate dehydratase [Allofustis seminis]
MKKITQRCVANYIPIRDPHMYKGSFKKILCIGGNFQMGGAILLASAGALQAGAGLVTVASVVENRTPLYIHTPECMFVDIANKSALKQALQQNEVILLGPGLGRNQQARDLYQWVLNQITTQQLIIDADGLYWLSELQNNFSTCEKMPILTPHLGEWERLSHMAPPATDINKNKCMQQKLNAYVVLKKHRTQLYTPQNIWENTAGNPSMATGGMGDILAGIIAGFVSQFDDVEKALVSAIYIHSYTADVLAHTHYVTLPTQIISNLPQIIAKLTQLKEDIDEKI